MTKSELFMAEVDAAAAYVEKQRPKAEVQAPRHLWAAWSMRIAFMAGVQWERDRKATEEFIAGNLATPYKQPNIKTKET